jgi:transcriptional regulator GlxA family with amidase domain
MATIVVLAPTPAMASSLVVAKELLHMAASASRRRGESDDEVVTVTEDGGPVVCGAGISLAADRAVADVPRCDLVWIAGYWNDLVAGAAANRALVPALVAWRDGGAELVGHGPGAYLLAEAGLLDGRLATVYRAQVEVFRERHPAIDLQPQRAITDAGGIYCAVGLDSGRDLLVTLIERRYGPRIGAEIAAWALNDSQRGYRSASSAFDGQRYHGDVEVLKIQDWMEAHHRAVTGIEQLAHHFAMSSRTLTRRFRAATGDSPTEYLRRVRVETAKDLLRNSNLTVTEVAVEVGYRDIGAFYDAFAKHTGRRPGAYRNAARVAPWDDTRADR